MQIVHPSELAKVKQELNGQPGASPGAQWPGMPGLPPGAAALQGLPPGMPAGLPPGYPPGLLQVIAN